MKGSIATCGWGCVFFDAMILLYTKASFDFDSTAFAIDSRSHSLFIFYFTIVVIDTMCF